jgi:hypothetical protein
MIGRGTLSGQPKGTACCMWEEEAYTICPSGVLTPKRASVSRYSSHLLKINSDVCRGIATGIIQVPGPGMSTLVPSSVGEYDL